MLLYSLSELGFNSLYGPPWSNTIPLQKWWFVDPENKDRKKIILRIDHLIFIEHCSKGFTNHQVRMNLINYITNFYHKNYYSQNWVFFCIHVSHRSIRITGGFCYTYRLGLGTLGFTTMPDDPCACQSLKITSEQELTTLLCLCEAKICASFRADTT